MNTFLINIIIIPSFEDILVLKLNKVKKRMSSSLINKYKDVSIEE